MPVKNMGSATMRFNEGIIVSGTAGSDTGTLLVTGSVYVTGSNSFRALDVYANISNDYVVAIDNDAGSSGHGLKVTTDGTGTGTTILDLEAGSTTVFKVRGDGRVGIGVGTPGSTLSVDDEIAVGEKLIHRGDPDTYLMFADDELHLAAGGRTFLKLEEASTDKLIVNHGGLDIDLQVKGENDANLVRTDAGNDSIYFGASSGAGVDNNFFVSGSISSKGTATRGTAVFGGDLVVSGALHAAGEGIIVSGALGSTYALHASGTVEAENLFLDDVEPTIQFKEGGSDRAEIQINDSDNLLITNQSTNKFIVFKTNDAGNIREGLRIGGTVPEVVVNEGADSLIDFRVESDNNTHMLFVDGGNEKIGIKDSTPTSTLTVNGSISLAVRKIDAANDPGTTFTIPDTDCVVLVNTRPTAQNGIDSAITLTLPDASDNPGMVLTIKDSAGYSDVNAITISAAAGDNIDGNPSVTSIDLPTPASFKKLISDGTNSWYEIGS